MQTSSSSNQSSATIHPLHSRSVVDEADNQTILHRRDVSRHKNRNRWSWACRSLVGRRFFQVLSPDTGYLPRPGDVVLAEVLSVGKETHVLTATNEPFHLYVGDVVVGLIGHTGIGRESVSKVETDELELVSKEGVVGKIQIGMRKDATRISIRAYLGDANGTRINLKDLLFQPTRRRTLLPPILFVVGTASDENQSADTAALLNSLKRRGLKTVVCRLTGMSSNMDLQELLSSGASGVRDLSDYGFPLTHGCRPVELAQLFYTQLADVSDCEPDLIVVQLSDGILNPQTRLILGEAACINSVAGVVLSASCSLSALCGVEILEQLGLSVAAVRCRNMDAERMKREIGLMRSDLAVCDADGTVEDASDAVMHHMSLQWLPLGSRVLMHNQADEQGIRSEPISTADAA